MPKPLPPSQTYDAADTNASAAHAEDRPPEDAGTWKEPVFWKELYGLIAVCLLGIVFALAVVPAKARRYWSLIQHEANLQVRNEQILQQIRILDEATESFLYDPYYKDAVIRERLGLKKSSENYLERQNLDDGSVIHEGPVFYDEPVISEGAAFSEGRAIEETRSTIDMGGL